MPIDVLLDYPEEQEVANEPSITELVEHEKQTRNEEEEEEEAGIELQSKLTAEQAVDIMEEVALFFMLLDHDTQEQIALANKLRDAAKDVQTRSLTQSTLDAYLKH
ncbi:hypothetical protein BGX31_006753 [Mortierella sp. GBA43]|nr:hypothetical protein BGX31_006753 [Mortierella sp. GBA43]